MDLLGRALLMLRQLPTHQGRRRGLGVPPRRRSPPLRLLARSGRVLTLGLGTMGLLLGVAVSPAASQATVQRVDVTITFEEIAPPTVLGERLQATVQSVADRLLLGRSVEELQPAQAKLGETLSEVVARVATGYGVANVTIGVGVNSAVAIRLMTLGTVIRTAEVTVDARALHPKLQPLLARLLERAAVPEVRTLYVGVPVQAWDWAGPLLDLRARAALESALEGYTASVHALPDAVARIDLVIAVRDSRTIRNFSVRFRSASIPILLLDQHAPQVTTLAEPLRGIPVVFAQAHQRDLEELLDAELAAYPPVQEYGVVASVGLDIAETTHLTVVADSLTWRGRVEAQLNIGQRAPGPTILVHLGRIVVPPAEGFVEIRIIPNTLGVDWDLGTQLALAPTTFVGVSYAVGPRTITAFTRFQVSRDVSLRGAWNLTDQSFEGGVNYRANDFLAGELIATSRGEIWFRIISNL